MGSRFLTSFALSTLHSSASAFSQWRIAQVRTLFSPSASRLALQHTRCATRGNSSTAARNYRDLALLLLNEVRAGFAAKERLSEAWGYAEQALAIDEALKASATIWESLSILADIADLEGRAEVARDYRRREREAAVAFEGNRAEIDRRFGQLIVAIGAAARGDRRARTEVERVVPRLEANGSHIAPAIQRIWAGEREWHSLVEDLNWTEALIVLRALETLEQASNAW